MAHPRAALTEKASSPSACACSLAGEGEKSSTLQLEPPSMLSQGGRHAEEALALLVDGEGDRIHRECADNDGASTAAKAS